MSVGVGISVGLEQCGRARAERAVRAQVPRHAGTAGLPGTPGGSEGTPVAHGLREHVLPGQAADGLEVRQGRDVRRSDLVHQCDPLRCRVPQRVEQGRGAVRDEVEEREAHEVVGVALDPPIGVPVRVDHTGDPVQQRARDQGGVPVDTGDVSGPAPGGAVGLGQRGDAALRPGRLVPAEAEDDGEASRPRMGGNPVQCLTQGAGPGEIECGEVEAGRAEVRVGVDECRGDQPALQLDDRGRVVREPLGGVVVADPDDLVVLDADRAGVRVGR